jgi:hypothetical protein
MDEDEDNIYGRKICSLLTTLCRNYEVLLVKPSEGSVQLFTLLKDAAMAKNLRIASSTIDFWEEFYETITTRLENLSQMEHLFSPYVDMVKIMLV